MDYTEQLKEMGFKVFEGLYKIEIVRGYCSIICLKPLADTFWPCVMLCAI